MGGGECQGDEVALSPGQGDGGVFAEKLLEGNCIVNITCAVAIEGT